MSNGEGSPVVIVDRSSGIGAFLWGAVVGAAAALLLAPRTGEETREVLRTRGRRLRLQAEDAADTLKSRVEDSYEQAKSRVEEGFEAARSTLSDTRDGARDAVDAGKAAVHTARDELERRLSDARSSRKRSKKPRQEVVATADDDTDE
ncbi:MAG: YtxH domain-containing protein [Gemmatimonadales bacterium]